VAGCALLCWVELTETVTDSSLVIWLAVAACVASGVTSALMVETCRALTSRGWTCATILAHRFYLTIALAVAWMIWDPPLAVMPEAQGVGLVLLVGAFAILVPALLFQLALRRVDSVSFIVCMAAQPVISFALALPSPTYEWNSFMLVGVTAVSLCLLWDIATTNSLGLPRPGLNRRLSAGLS
jgi:drug/metabolite transporter (DMT)-like permease